MNGFVLLLFVLCSSCASVFAYFYPEKTHLMDFVEHIEISEFRSGMRNVDCIYVLNLEERRERWERSQRYFQEQGLFPNRVNAINGWKMPYWKRAVITGPYLIRMPAGLLACTLGHVGIYKDAYDRGWNAAWICEDDMEFVATAKYVDEMIDELNCLDPEWDLFYTDLVRHGNGTQDPRPGQPLFPSEFQQINEHFYKIHSRCLNHSIIFSRRGLEKLVAFYEHVYLWSPIDIDIHYAPNLKEYSSAKDLVTRVRSGSFSDTETGSTLNDSH